MREREKVCVWWGVCIRIVYQNKVVWCVGGIFKFWRQPDSTAFDVATMTV